MLDSNFISVPPKFSFWANYSPNPTVQVCDILYGGTLIQGSELTIGLYTISFKSGNGGNCLKNKIFQPGYIDQEDQNHTYKEVNSFDSLIVNNVKYFNVICTQSQFVGYNGEKPLLTFYLGKYVGLIKYDQKIGDADTTWSLVRYNVIQ